jgi:4-methyl-5(b-hydroxyethyl)-thiazole monophosphate biosynthesis
MNMVYLLLAPGFEEAEALVPTDLLRRAGIQTLLVSEDGSPVCGGHGVRVDCQLPLSAVDLDKADMIVLPGGGAGVKALGENPAVETLVRQASAQSIPIAAICAAPTLLGRWGLLAGKRTVCYPGLEQQLIGAVACPGEKVVKDGLLITAQAAGAAFDFGLALIHFLAGPERAEEIRQSVCYDRS